MKSWWRARRTRTKVILVVVGLLVVLVIVSPKAAAPNAATVTPSPTATVPSSSTSAGVPTTAASPSSCHSTNGLPDLACTPGVADLRVTQENIGSTICVSGYTATVRPPATYTNALKIDQMRAYGMTNLTPADVEEDHLIALELGGDPRDSRNLWPEPRSGTNPAAAKDALENRLHAEVCAGTMTLADAQSCIAVEWVACLNRAAATAAPTSTSSPTPAAAPTAAGATTQIISVTSPVARNANATVRVQTVASASCTIVVQYASGPSKARGLEPKTADGAGAVAWTWVVGPNTTRGTWPITVTCGGISASTAFTVQ
jgi:hypothetical protein